MTTRNDGPSARRQFLKTAGVLAIGTAAVASGLCLWWLWDKVRDAVNANPRKSAEVNPAQSPHDDEQAPPQV